MQVVVDGIEVEVAPGATVLEAAKLAGERLVSAVKIAHPTEQEEWEERIKPALPPDAALNVNTASPMVLSSLADGLTPALAAELVSVRGLQGFRDLQGFLSQPVLAGLGVQGEGLAINTQYFQVISEVSVGDRRQVLVSQLQRGRDGRVRVLSRDLGQSGLPPAPVKESTE